MTSTVGAPQRCVTPSSSSSCQTSGGSTLRQADVRRARGGHRPGEAPAVAVEHRQRPQVDRARCRAGRARTSRERVQVGAAVGVHDALGPAGRAARVVDADRVVLARPAGPRARPPRAARGTPRSRRRLRTTRTRSTAASSTRWRSDSCHDEDPRAGVLEDVGDLLRHEPGVDRDEHGPGARHAEVRFEQLVDVRGEKRDPVAVRDPALLERHREPPHPLPQLAPT